MLRYWILRRPDGTPAGLVRAENDRALLTLNAPVEGRFTLFSASDAMPVTPQCEVRLSHPCALLGTDGDRVTCFAAAPDADPLSCYLDRLSRNCTNKSENAAEPAADPATSEEPVPVLDDLSQNNTMVSEEGTEIPDESEEPVSILSHDGPVTEQPEPNSISDTAHDTAEFALLLQRADAFYARFDSLDASNMVQKEDIRSEGGIDLFPQQFPGARWRYVDGADVASHYVGTWRSERGDSLRILAVRGRAAPRPPRTLSGFTTYLRGRDGLGYWVKVTREPNGR